MKRIILLTALLTAIALRTKCQDSLQGKWYMLSSNNIVELTITNDSFVIKGIDWDLKFRDPNQGFISRTIEKKVIANGNVYLYLISPKETINHLSLATITIVAPM